MKLSDLKVRESIWNPQNDNIINHSVLNDKLSISINENNVQYS